MRSAKPKAKRKKGSTMGSDSSSDLENEDPTTKYMPFKIHNYSRKYSENSRGEEFIVFLSSNIADKPIGEKEKLAISSAIRQFCINGVKYLKPINKYKVGIVFNMANNANVFLNNEKFHKNVNMTPSIPAAATEITGVLRGVPLELSNKSIFSLLASTSNVIQVRRLTTRVRVNEDFEYKPTGTVAVTFAATQLPQYVHLDSWRHEVSPFIPPVKQCLQCLRYGHIAKFCKNSVKCSICTENHNFKECIVEIENAKCYNCDGNHIAVSRECPIKKQKINENKTKARAFQYIDLFDEKTFPKLTNEPKKHLQHLLKSDSFMNLIVESIVKIISNKTDDNPISSDSIKNILLETFSKKKPPSTT